MKQTVNPANYYKLNNNWLLTDNLCGAPLVKNTQLCTSHYQLPSNCLILWWNSVSYMFYDITDLDEFEKHDVRLLINLF